MNGYSITKQREQWKNIPLDDIGYVDSKVLLEYDDTTFMQLMKHSIYNRYSGWRNVDNKWREYLGLDDTKEKIILDFGSGIGIEALQFAPRNQVIIADIDVNNLRVAQRTLNLNGYYPIDKINIKGRNPYFRIDYNYDVFYANGVLHHIPYATNLLKRVVQNLNPGGEIRLMLYSDRGWVKHGGHPLPSIYEKVEDSAGFEDFVKAFDAVGEYADWYNEEKINLRFGKFLKLKFFDYITDDDRYCVARLEPK